MILKRWGFNILGTLVASWAGIYGLHYLDQHIMMPKIAGLLILLSFVAGCLIITNYLGQRLFPPTEAEFIRPEVPRQPWAWLRPRGEGMKPGFPINKGQVSVGRDVRCEVMVNHSSVSRRHAEVVRLAEGYLLRDLGSRNGSFVNGQRVEEYLLQDGDVVGFGDKQLIFQAPKQPEPAEFEEPEHAIVPHLLSPEPLPMDDYSGSDIDIEEGGTEVWRNKKGTDVRSRD